MKIYCSGIGGIGLSAYAALQRANGHEVLGSDRELSSITQELQAQGIAVSDNQDGSHVPADIDLFVYSEAIPADAPERKKAAELGVEQMSYFKALGELSKSYTVIAVCGTHGKSTTTAMAAKALTDAGLDPTVVVGTKVPQLDGKNWRKGESNLFVLEACEYKGSFLHLHPSVILLTNVDWDHVDAYPTEDAYKKAYTDFIATLPKDGVVIGHPSEEQLVTSTGTTFVNADTFDAPSLGVPGEHMQQNAKLVLALAESLQVDAIDSLAGFSGTWRRFEEKGTHKSGAIIVDDYAHHPKEIVATIASAHEKYPGRRIVCLFQPHMHDRTIALYQDFVQAFHGTDAVWLTDVYEARREAAAAQADIRALAEDIGEQCLYVGDMAAAEQFCRNNLQQNDVLLVMGAGNITAVASALAS